MSHGPERMAPEMPRIGPSPNRIGGQGAGSVAGAAQLAFGSQETGEEENGFPGDVKDGYR